MSDSEEENKAPEASEVPAEPEDKDKLDQGDIDKLMEDASESAIGSVFLADGTRQDSGEKVSIKSYDFRNPPFLSESELRFINLKHKKYVEYLSSRLALFLRKECQIEAKETKLITFSKVVQAIKAPTHVAIFQSNKLPSMGLLNISNDISFGIINRMLGGRGTVPTKQERPLTDIEVGLMHEVLELILSEWSSIWKDVIAFDVSIVGKDNDPKYLNVLPRDSVMLFIELEVKLGEVVGLIHLALPSMLLQPVAIAIQEKMNSFTDAPAANKRPARWASAYADISVPVHAEWDVAPLSVSDFLKLRIGDVIEMPKDLLASTQIRVMNTPCFLGEAGVDQGSVAVKINNKIKKQP